MEPVLDQKVAIDSILLTPIVCKATGREDMRLNSWQVHPIAGGSEQESAVLRLAGEGVSAGENIPYDAKT